MATQPDYDGDQPTTPPLWPEAATWDAVNLLSCQEEALHVSMRRSSFGTFVLGLYPTHPAVWGGLSPAQ